MKQNIGTIDRFIRIAVGIGILGAGYYYRNWWGLVGALPILTAIVRICPAYMPFGLSTCGVKKEDSKTA